MGAETADLRSMLTPRSKNHYVIVLENLPNVGVNGGPFPRLHCMQYDTITYYSMSFRYALQHYIEQPESSALFYDDNVVIIRDAFPKSFCHLLVLPRDKRLTLKHPLDAFKEQPDLYDEMSFYVEKAKDMAVDAAVSANLIADTKPARREYRNQYVKAGIHSVPSLANLHIHVVTQDFHLARMKNRKHYNSFTTRFFVDFDRLDPGLGVSTTKDYLDAFLDSGDDSEGEIDGLDARKGQTAQFERDPAVLEGIIRTTPLTCVYCHKVFGGRFAGLKTHLAEEFTSHFGENNLEENNSQRSDE